MAHIDDDGIESELFFSAEGLDGAAGQFAQVGLVEVKLHEGIDEQDEIDVHCDEVECWRWEFCQVPTFFQLSMPFFDVGSQAIVGEGIGRFFVGTGTGQGPVPDGAVLLARAHDGDVERHGAGIPDPDVADGGDLVGLDYFALVITVGLVNCPGQLELFDQAYRLGRCVHVGLEWNKDIDILLALQLADPSAVDKPAVDNELFDYPRSDRVNEVANQPPSGTDRVAFTAEQICTCIEVPPILRQNVQKAYQSVTGRVMNLFLLLTNL